MAAIKAKSGVWEKRKNKIARNTPKIEVRKRVLGGNTFCINENTPSNIMANIDPRERASPERKILPRLSFKKRTIETFIIVYTLAHAVTRR
jgi:hypothetical protein